MSTYMKRHHRLELNSCHLFLLWDRFLRSICPLGHYHCVLCFARSQIRPRRRHQIENRLADLESNSALHPDYDHLNTDGNQLSSNVMFND